MAITLDQVRHWLILDGVGHILMRVHGYWSFTACGTMTTGGDRRKRQPKRLCRKCRAELNNMHLTKPEPLAQASPKAGEGARGGQ